MTASGSIPACAGEPSGRCAGRAAHRVYPRVCGGTEMAELLAQARAGLSPRVRGNLAGDKPAAPTGRSIPACAGEPIYRRPAVSGLRVYPRVCGGTPVGCLSGHRAVGLSPRVRGNRRRRLAARRRRRSIPACAGEPRNWGGSAGGTPQPARQLLPLWVYPRVCGGTQTPPAWAPSPGGLSPRVRGNPTDGISNDLAQRSIPACAGEPDNGFGFGTCLAVYPRVCGGTQGRGPNRTPRHGLSPRVRGNLPPAAADPRLLGSIPACAGEPAVE